MSDNVGKEVLGERNCTSKGAEVQRTIVTVNVKQLGITRGWQLLENGGEGVVGKAAARRCCVQGF